MRRTRVVLTVEVPTQVQEHGGLNDYYDDLLDLVSERYFVSDVYVTSREA